MDTYLVEPLIAVIPLNIIMLFYLKRVYARAESYDKNYLRLGYAVTAGLITDAAYCIILRDSVMLPVTLKLIVVYVRQSIFILVCYALMEYLILNDGRPLDKKLMYFRRGLLGVYFYTALVLLFIGVNAHIENGRVVFGAGRTVFSFLLPFFFIVTGVVSVWLQRARLSVYRLRIYAIVLFGLVAHYLAHYFFFQDLLADMMIASCVVYVCFFALETPAYAQLEQTIADLNNARERAEETGEAARAADEDMGTFLANMSHEIRTPLTTILGMNEIIMKRNAGSGAEEKEIYAHARDVESAGKSLVHIINDILDFSKIESGELELVVQPYHLGQVLRDINNMISLRASEKDLQYIASHDRSLPDELNGDRIRIQQIMVNLLNNAVKYTRKGQVRFSITGERGNDPSYITLHITVTDTGIGIRKEDLPKLFHSFQRIDLKETHDIEGTGLGLAITGRLVDLMGGHIEVHSVYGQGSTFKVSIPQRVSGTRTISDYEQTDVREEEKGRTFTAPDKRVLIVDDNEMNRVVLEALLEETQVQTAQAASGEEALALCETEHFDLILMDYMMPVMDGIETLHRLRAMKDAVSRDAHVIVCTANAVVGVRAELFAAGFEEFLSKPVDPEELKNVLERFLSDAGAPHDLIEDEADAAPDKEADVGLS